MSEAQRSYLQGLSDALKIVGGHKDAKKPIAAIKLSLKCRYSEVKRESVK